tara:strand:+ start:5244 stop:5933 length:690 start_codon:yes stop_codon:yes gene_type:complete
MALILLQPGIQPIGQFDLDDADAALCTGGQVGLLQALDLPPGDGYAADVGQVGPRLQVELGSLAAASAGGGGLVTGSATMWGLVDEGTTGYGTLFGTVIGGTAGQGTGFGTRSTQGVVVVGPDSNMASGKCTLWSQAGLYGVTANGFAVGTVAGVTAAAFGLNGELDGHLNDGTAASGRLEASGLAAEVACLFLGNVSDSSLVSTSATAIGLQADTEYFAVWSYGPNQT